MEENKSKKICLVGIGRFGFDALMNLHEEKMVADMYFVAMDDSELHMYYLNRDEHISLLDLNLVKSFDINEISDILDRYAVTVTVSDAGSLDPVIAARRLANHAEHNWTQIIHCIPEGDRNDNRRETLLRLLRRGASLVIVPEQQDSSISSKAYFHEIVKKNYKKHR